MKLVPKQLAIAAVETRDLGGVEMGVLDDGMPFLTGRGLAAVCGVVPSVINQWANEYEPSSMKPRDVAITRLIEKYGYAGDALFYKMSVGGREVNAYPEAICSAVIEYYAFEADRKSDQALQSFRTFSRAGLRAFVYSALGYDPLKKIPDPFRSYHQRQMLNTVPRGMYSCFSETAHLVLTSIQAGLVVDSHTVPDGSVGRLWSKHWVDSGLAKVFGERSRHPHVFPPDYPQSAVTPEAFVYPLSSLGPFREWLDTEYLPKNYPGYLARKVKAGALPASRAELLIDALVPKELGDGEED